MASAAASKSASAAASKSASAAASKSASAATSEAAGEAAGEATPQFEPKIVAFVCNWCTYTGADLAGTSRLQMAPNVRVVRLPCTGRIDPLFITKAFEGGADGVIVSGCHPADCHYTAGNYHARRRFAIFRDLLDFMGVDVRRTTFSWVSASEGGKWRDVVNDTTARVKQLGPFAEYQGLSVAPPPARSQAPASGERESSPPGRGTP
jgi:coenzyme F420-reducing hydrogenase delta subunit